MLYRVEEVAAPAGFITFVAVNFSCLFWYRRFLGIPRGKATLLWLAALIIAIALFTYQIARQRESFQLSQSGGFEAMAALASVGSLVFFLAAFIAKLYLKWIGGSLTEEEKAQGSAGVRAWLSVQNITCAFLVSLCASLGYGYSFWGIFALTLAALLAYPAVHYAPQSASPPEIKKEEPSAERERILKLLEDGKINAAESATLLHALGRPARTHPLQLAPTRKLTLIGAALVLLGFFLPWFSINPGQELNRNIQSLIGNLPQPLSALGADLTMPLKLTTGSISINGGEIHKGLGWLALILGIAAAVLPHAATAMDAHSQRLLTLACLGTGAVVLFYLLTQNFRFSSIGIILVLAGYALEFLATIKERSA